MPSAVPLRSPFPFAPTQQETKATKRDPVKGGKHDGCDLLLLLLLFGTSQNFLAQITAVTPAILLCSQDQYELWTSSDL